MSNKKECHNRAMIENSEHKTILNESYQECEFMDIEEARRLTIESVKKIYEMNGKLYNNKAINDKTR